MLTQQNQVRGSRETKQGTNRDLVVVYYTETKYEYMDILEMEIIKGTLNTMKVANTTKGEASKCIESAGEISTT